MATATNTNTKPKVVASEDEQKQSSVQIDKDIKNLELEMLAARIAHQMRIDSLQAAACKYAESEHTQEELLVKHDLLQAKRKQAIVIQFPNQFKIIYGQCIDAFLGRCNAEYKGVRTHKFRIGKTYDTLTYMADFGLPAKDTKDGPMFLTNIRIKQATGDVYNGKKLLGVNIISSPPRVVDKAVYVTFND